jgi:hypothetical protein
MTVHDGVGPPRGQPGSGDGDQPRGWHPNHLPPDEVGDDSVDKNKDRPPTRSRRKKRLMIAAGAVLAAVVIGVVGEAMRPAKPGRRVLTDSQYVRRANNECAKTLPGLRPPDAGPFGKTDTPAQTAAQIARATDGLDALAGRLAALPTAAVDRPHLTVWLDGWHRYSDLGRRYAEFLLQHGSAKPGQLLTDSANEAKSADAFALANGLKACTFLATPQPDPSNGF